MGGAHHRPFCPPPLSLARTSAKAQGARTLTSPNPFVPSLSRAQAQQLNRDIFECMYFAALRTSMELAKVRAAVLVLVPTL